MVLGTWILGFSRFLGSCSSVMAELWGLVEGLKIAWSMGFKNVWMEMDSKVVVEMVRRGCASCRPYFALVNEARFLLQKDWSVKVSHAYREANFVADWLAGWAIKCKFSSVFSCPPSGCSHLVVADMAGTCFLRCVAV